MTRDRVCVTPGPGMMHGDQGEWPDTSTAMKTTQFSVQCQVCIALTSHVRFMALMRILNKRINRKYFSLKIYRIPCPITNKD